jgi:integrase
MAFSGFEKVAVTDPLSGKGKRVAGLRRRLCGSYVVKNTGAVTKTMPDYEYSADFTINKIRYRTVLCRASEFADQVTFSREAGQWINPALEIACAKLEEYRQNAAKGDGPTRREEERRHEEQQRKIKAEVDRQRELIAARKNITVAELVDKYDGFVKGKLKAYLTTKGHLERIRTDLGTLPLRELTLEHVEEWQRALKTLPRPARTDSTKPTEPLSVVTVNRYLQTLKAMMTKACDWKLITERRLRELRKIKLADERYNRRNDFLSREDAERLIDKADPQIQPIIICALQTGMRKGEILGLRWSQVDLTHRVVHLPQTKSGEPRSLPINNRLLSTLKGLVRNISDDHVFWNPETGKRWSDLKRLFRRATIKSKLTSRGIVFHHLRHTAASWMVMAGVPLATVAAILGHADIKMVMRYAHLSKGHLDVAIATLDGSTPPKTKPKARNNTGKKSNRGR